MSEIKIESFAEYRADLALNFSRLKRMDKSPLDYLADPPRTFAAAAIGQAIHMAVLEPELFDRDAIVYPGKTRRGKDWDAFKEVNKDKTILSRSELWTCKYIQSAVSMHPVASKYFDKGQAEVSIYWQHELGFECKSRIDWLSDDLVLDLKSAKDVTPGAFARQCANLQYHAQLSFYAQAAKSIDGRDRRCVILAVEKDAPYDVVPYLLPDEAVAAGARLIADWMLKLKQCQETQYWPGVSDREVELHLPDWAFSEMDDAKLIIDGIEVAL